jgi:hypothetical protein
MRERRWRQLIVYHVPHKVLDKVFVFSLGGSIDKEYKPYHFSNQSENLENDSDLYSAGSNSTSVVLVANTDCIGYSNRLGCLISKAPKFIGALYQPINSWPIKWHGIRTRAVDITLICTIHFD